jgi:hypothetical protein
MGYEALVEDKARHLRLLEITPDLILSLLTINEERRVTINGQELSCVEDAIPATARVASCGISGLGNVLIQVEDSSFGPVPPGARIPHINPVYRCSGK